jgi:superfamily II DNA or RNA helicase
MLKIFFSDGTLLLDGNYDEIKPVINYLKIDERVKMFRAKACHYGLIIAALKASEVNFDDQALAYQPLKLNLRTKFAPRPHQQRALDAWLKGGSRGIVAMPTGSGKTFLAAMAIVCAGVPALVVVPTIDLLQQWAGTLEQFFGCKVGMLGGGSKEVLDLTVSTYDSAVLRMEFIGNRFGLIVFDECHHLPGAVNRMSAMMSLAPARLGLSATPEHENGETVFEKLIGPLVYEVHIDQLENHILAPYTTRRIPVQLTPEENAEYSAARHVYTNFLRRNGITFSGRNDWNRFIWSCARQTDGREAFDAYLNQKRIARNCSGKFSKVWELLKMHRGERIIIFTAANDTAYEFGCRFLLPVITHRTKAAERKAMLDKFRNGTYPVLVTSKVLNEGVDVPEASIGIVVSGSGSIREHVQRLGRILRAGQGKSAILYEMVSEHTSEEYVSRRRREHRAYKHDNSNG